MGGYIVAAVLVILMYVQLMLGFKKNVKIKDELDNLKNFMDAKNKAEGLTDEEKQNILDN